MSELLESSSTAGWPRRVTISPGSDRIDRVTRASEYADAGVPTSWVVRRAEPTTLSERRLSDDGHDVVARHTVTP